MDLNETVSGKITELKKVIDELLFFDKKPEAQRLFRGSAASGDCISATDTGSAVYTAARTK